jgi:hypothetical protein
MDYKPDEQSLVAVEKQAEKSVEEDTEINGTIAYEKLRQTWTL